MSNHPSFASFDPSNYPLHILHIKPWEWEGVKEKWESEMLKHGPFQEGADAADTAVARIKELKEAITILNTHQP